MLQRLKNKFSSLKFVCIFLSTFGASFTLPSSQCHALADGGLVLMVLAAGAVVGGIVIVADGDDDDNGNGDDNPGDGTPSPTPPATTPTPPATTPTPPAITPVLETPTTPGDGEGPGWRLPDTSEEDGDIVLEGGNSLPRPSGDSSSNDPSKRSSDSSSSV